MGKTTDSLVRITAAGGGLIIDCEGKTIDSLVRIAAATKTKGSKIIMTNLKGKTTNSLLRIVDAGDGNVILDVRE